MSKLINEYLIHLYEFGMPTMALMPARRPAGYGSNVSKETDEPTSLVRNKAKKAIEKIKKEYSSYSPDGNRYGYMVQRPGQGGQTSNAPIQSAPSSQKIPEPKFKIDIDVNKKKDRKRRKK